MFPLRHWTPLETTQNKGYHNSLLGNEHWRGLDSIQHSIISSLWSNVFFEREIISHSNYKILQRKPFIMHLKSHTMQQGCFFLHFVFAYRWPIESKFSQIYFTHKCWKTPSENVGFWQYYQTYPVPLSEQVNSNTDLIQLWGARYEF